MKKLLLVLMMMVSIVLPTVAEARGFSGGHSSSFGSHSRSYSGGTYHSGYKSPSSHVTRTPSSKSYSNYGSSSPSRTKSFFTHAAAFGAGAFLGHMFHPFGGSYYGGSGYGSYGFSFFGLLIDIVIILIIVRLIKGIFSRRRY